MLGRKPTTTKGAVKNQQPHNISRSLMPRRGYVLVFVCVLAVVALVKFAPPIELKVEDFQLAKVEKVTVLGDLTYVPEHAVIETLRPYSDMSVVTLPLKQMQAELESINWVDRAVLVRKLPAELMVTIVPQKPIARWKDQGLVNNRGEIFMVDAVDEEFSNLPVLDGDREALGEIMGTYIDIDQVLRGQGLDIIRLQRSDRGAWELLTSDGATVVFSNEGVVDATQRFLMVHNYLGSDAANKRFDTRHNSGVAVL